MTTKIYEKLEDGSERVIEIQENGETVWADEDYFQRTKFSQASKDDLINDLEKGNLEAYCKKTFEILTGETVQEAKQ